MSTRSRRSRHRRDRGAAALLVAPLVVEACAAVLAFGALTLFVPSADAARGAALGYLGALERADYRAGYDRLCVRTQEALTGEQFADAARSRPRPRGHRVLRTALHGLGGVSHEASVEVEVVDAGGATERQVLDLRYEGGAWKVCGDPNRVRAPVIR